MVNATPWPPPIQSVASPLRHYVSPFHEPEKRGFGNRKRLWVTECDRATIDIDPTLIPFSILPTESACAANASLASIRSHQPTASQHAPGNGGSHTPAHSHQCRIYTNAGKCADAGQHGKFNARALASLIIITAAAPSLWMMHYPLSQSRDYQMKDLKG